MTIKQKANFHLVFLLLSIIALIVTIVLVLRDKNTVDNNNFNSLLLIALFSVSILANGYRYAKVKGEK